MIRENDTVLINEFIRLGYTETALVRLNRVQKHFKILYMSDITEGNGKKIKESIYPAMLAHEGRTPGW